MKKIALSLGILLLCACTKTEKPFVTIVIPNADPINIEVEVAQTQEEMAQGLMGREELLENHGMIFMFSDNQVRTFWMKNTPQPLDILFYDEKGRFVSSRSMKPCKKDPCSLYSSNKPAMYALELRAGFITAHPSLKQSTIVLPENL